MKIILITLISLLLLIFGLSYYFYLEREIQKDNQRLYVVPLIKLTENIDSIKEVKFIIDKETSENYFVRGIKQKFFKNINNFKTEIPSELFIQMLKRKLLDPALTKRSFEVPLFSPWYPVKIFMIKTENSNFIWFLYEKSIKSIYLVRYDSEGYIIDEYESNIAMSELK